MPLTAEERRLLRKDINLNENDASRAIGEAMQAAASAVKEDKTINGRIRGVKKGQRRVSARMRSFASLVAQGKSSREAYRTAYECSDRQEHLVVAGAGRLMRDERVKLLTAEVWESVSENIIADAVATRRFVMQQLKTHADTAKQDSAKLKALELMGRAIGMFTDKVDSKVEEISTDKLKAELESSMRLLDNVTPIRKEAA